VGVSFQDDFKHTIKHITYNNYLCFSLYSFSASLRNSSKLQIIWKQNMNFDINYDSSNFILQLGEGAVTHTLGHWWYSLLSTLKTTEAIYGRDNVACFSGLSFVDCPFGFLYRLLTLERGWLVQSGVSQVAIYIIYIVIIYIYAKYVQCIIIWYNISKWVILYWNKQLDCFTKTQCNARRQKETSIVLLS
jgi:hypothetical protein